MKTAILILAAGESSRMGESKQLLPIGETTLLGRAIEGALKSKTDKVYCVVGANSDAIQKSIQHYAIEIIHNNYYQLGLSSSIIEGVKYLESKNYDAILMMLGDQPKVDIQYLNQLIDELNKQPSKIIASSYAGISGVPAIFPKSYFKQLLHLKGDKGANPVLNSPKTEVIKIDSTKLKDIDTKEDYLDFLDSL
jgi:molybdenum cofactor cytidylyltransferase